MRVLFPIGHDVHYMVIAFGEVPTYNFGAGRDNRNPLITAWKAGDLPQVYPHEFFYVAGSGIAPLISRL